MRQVWEIFAGRAFIFLCVIGWPLLSVVAVYGGLKVGELFGYLSAGIGFISLASWLWIAAQLYWGAQT